MFSSSGGATGQSSPDGVTDASRPRYQTFHSSNEMAIRVVCLPAARTASAVATTSSMNESMLTAEARNEAMSPSFGQ